MKIKSKWYDINVKRPRKGQTVTLLLLHGPLIQAKCDPAYVGGFSTQNCSGSACVGLHWGRYWSPSYIAKPSKAFRKLHW